MGVKDWFRKAWGNVKNGIKAGYNWVKDTAVPWVRDRAIPFLGRIADVGTKVMSNLPGVFGKIGKIGSVVFDTIRGIGDKVPNQQMGQKINEWADSAQGKLNSGLNRGVSYSERGARMGQDISEGVNNVKRTIDM